jgi:hypothetical protein
MFNLRSGAAALVIVSCALSGCRKPSAENKTTEKPAATADAKPATGSAPAEKAPEPVKAEPAPTPPRPAPAPEPVRQTPPASASAVKSCGPVAPAATVMAPIPDDPGIDDGDAEPADRLRLQ